MSFCHQCGAAAPKEGTCEQCGARLGAPGTSDLRQGALNFLLIVASMLMAATFALIMLLVAKWEDLGTIPVIMGVGILLTRLAIGFAVSWFARILDRPHPALLGLLALLPGVEVLIAGSLLLQARGRITGNSR